MWPVPCQLVRLATDRLAVPRHSQRHCPGSELTPLLPPLAHEPASGASRRRRFIESRGPVANRLRVLLLGAALTLSASLAISTQPLEPDRTAQEVTPNVVATGGYGLPARADARARRRFGDRCGLRRELPHDLGSLRPRSTGPSRAKSVVKSRKQSDDEAYP